MKGNRRRDTKPELALRRLLHSRGLRYRVDFRVLQDVRRRADVVFTRSQVAVFVDGCYWHGCPTHGTVSKTNTTYWVDKIAANRRRDRDTDLRLEEAGWLVLRFWEHDDAAEAADRVEAEVRSRSR